MTNQYDPNAILVVPVEGIGTFTFAMRTLGNQFKIEAEYGRLTEGIPDITPFLGNLAQYVADLSVLTVTAPEGWSREQVLLKDGFDPETYVQIQKVWSALSDKEAEFRGLAASPPNGQGDGADGGAAVPAPVSSGAD